ncbi:MAG TPA: 4-alpha-glucanotransferase [Candidatus Binatia bacterium]|jgi:4-alpha-glucanotransferase
MSRASGVLLHITSLPSPFGIGDLGPWAYRFADFLAAERQTYWQILPLAPTDPVRGNSPYDSRSAFAGNPLIISPELLLREDWLRPEDLEEHPPFARERVQYEIVTAYKARLLDKVFQRYQNRAALDGGFEKFCDQNAGWLEDYSLFTALKARFDGAPWPDWPEPLRDREKSALTQWKKKCREEMKKEKLFQYLFFQQWSALKEYANGKKILFVGDLPIYVSGDSADVWANPHLFKLDKAKRPTVVAGVPPDYFSATGQLWGNPVYRWDALKETNYAWWFKRLRHNLACFDRVRLDHFRGFVAYWEVPAGERTAKNGRWVKAASDDFFAGLVLQFHGLPFFVEDLGLITPDVRKVMKRFGFAGMKLLLFAFGDDMASNPYAVHNHEKNSVVYTGTHDNNTVKGWFLEEASADDRERLCAYVGHKVAAEMAHWELIRLCFMSVADTAIIPMQDLLGLGSEARMNRPATTEGNWAWRFIPEQITSSLSAELSKLAEIYGRVPGQSRGSQAD